MADGTVDLRGKIEQKATEEKQERDKWIAEKHRLVDGLKKRGGHDRSFIEPQRN